MRRHVIQIQPQAPTKPAVGQPCNGCGVCCLAEPCPLGMLLSGRRRGACDALQWHPAERRYRCGAIRSPRQVAQAAVARLPRWLTVPISVPLAWLLAAAAARWIAAGQGCDCTLEVQPGRDAASAGRVQ